MLESFQISNLITGLAIVPVLGFLIFIHEMGHFLAARMMGVRVLEFGFGYPPRAATLFERNGVKYTLNWLPFGGFVKMAGEDGGFDDPNSLPNVSPWRRIVVMAAGPFMNVVTAIVIFAVLMMAGVPQFSGDQNTLPVQIIGISADSPASLAGLQAGDIIRSIDGVETTGIDAVSDALRTGAGQDLVVIVLRGEEEVSAIMRPRLPQEIPPGQGAAGIQISSYVSDEDLELVRYDPGEALVGGVNQTYQTTTVMISGLSELVRGLISPAVETPEGGVGGVVAIGRITAEFAREGWRELLGLTAFLSINLAILNLLPIPALDGGRIMFALAEIISRRRIPPEKEAVVHFAGFAILLAFMVFVTFIDISNWIAGKPALPGG